MVKNRSTLIILMPALRLVIYMGLSLAQDSLDSSAELN
jgi:hypothetical protein